MSYHRTCLVAPSWLKQRVGIKAYPCAGYIGAPKRFSMSEHRYPVQSLLTTRELGDINP